MRMQEREELHDKAINNITNKVMQKISQIEESRLSSTVSRICSTKQTNLPTSNYSYSTEYKKQRKSINM